MARINASCVSCGTTDLVLNMVKTSLLDRGGRVAYLCPHCAERVEGYSTTTGNKGKDKSELWTASEELETSNHTPEGRANLLRNGFEPTSDSSLGRNGVEFKSPVYHGFGGLVKLQKSIEKLENSGAIEMNYLCGHHLHIGRVSIVNHLTGELYDINATALNMAWKYRHELLIPLGDYLENHSNECKALFGRALGEWAQHPRDAWSGSERCHDNRYCYINLCTEGKDEYGRRRPELAKTVEFRVNRFRNAEQYSRVIMLEKKMTQALITNFWDYALCNSVSAEELKHQAEKTGNKLLQLVLKEVEKIDC